MNTGRNISLTDHLNRFIDVQVERGRHQNASEVVREALRLLDERDRRLQWLRAEIAIGDEQIARGELIDFTHERFEQIKRAAPSAVRCRTMDQWVYEHGPKRSITRFRRDKCAHDARSPRSAEPRPEPPRLATHHRSKTPAARRLESTR